ncbi:DUF3955 domain-containing protein [Maridesulfovibrio ferrireducens]|uniref:DUF3955 domain-containing protein n=1 Tax=Maridesulfovibrio ferrireducens TaxID=246191 RepID=UPI001A191B7D|nr:DUF3955 domain-containing protein [Maridesulfovibrio ferrireducens]MBI9110669.1 DUF3955 domain-containing protein [Maridesulfovibrio ferrireducens]
MFKHLISFKTSLFFICVSIACAIAFNTIGSTIDSEGILHEPFALIPIGWLFFLLGILVGIVCVVQWLWSKR